MLNPRIFKEKQENLMNIIFFVLTDLKRKVKMIFVFVTKAETFLLKAFQEQIVSEIFFINIVFYTVKNKDDIKDLGELADLGQN